MDITSVGNLSTISIVNAIVGIIGFPTLIVLIWKASRSYTLAQLELKGLNEGQKEALALAVQVKDDVSTIQNNHLHHIEEAMTELADRQIKGFDLLSKQWEKSNEVFAEIKLSLAVIGDRLPRAKK